MSSRERGGSAYVTRVTDAITTNGDACAVLFGFLWADFTNNACVCDVTLAVGGYGMEVDGAKGVSALDVLFGGVGGVGANALAEAP